MADRVMGEEHRFEMSLRHIERVEVMLEVERQEDSRYVILSALVRVGPGREHEYHASRPVLMDDMVSNFDLIMDRTLHLLKENLRQGIEQGTRPSGLEEAEPGRCSAGGMHRPDGAGVCQQCWLKVVHG
jgi:hypothetical protein